MADSFFSISFDLVMTDVPLPYDLFINSSSIEAREKFVRLIKQGDSITREDIEAFRHKYHQLYLREIQRSSFLKSLVALKAPETPAPAATNEPGKPYVSPIDIQKTTVLKDSAIHHLETLFEKDPPTEVMTQTIVGCRDVVESMIDVLHDYNIDKLRELIANLSFHDFYTYDHSINVTMYCILIFQTLSPKATRQEIIQAGLSGLLHDLGKIKIPTEIINNAGKLSDAEFAEIKKHPDFGRELLTQNDLKLPADFHAETLGQIVCQHHENFDGTGYPRKLAGDQIHIMARITAIADFFDAITTKRSYADPLTIEQAVELMTKFEGKKIDPKLFHLFLQHTDQIAKKRQTNLTITDEDFDPCQPHKELPLAVAKQDSTTSTSKDFGQVKVVDQPKTPAVGQVKVIQEPAIKTTVGQVKVVATPEPPKTEFGKVKVLGSGGDDAKGPKPLVRKKA